MNIKNKILMTILVVLSVSGIGITAAAETANRRANIKSVGNLDFDNGTVHIASSDLTYLADEIDNLENTYKTTTVDALNIIGTYFKSDGSLTHDIAENEADTDEEKAALSFGKIKSAIASSQSIDSLSQTQATDKDGNLLFYTTEDAQNDKDLMSITTDDTGFPVYYQAATAANLSAGTAAWVNGTLIKGDGSDNAAYFDNGYAEGYTEGYEAGINKTGEIQYTYHAHINSCYCKGTIKYTGREELVYHESWTAVYYVCRCSSCNEEIWLLTNDGSYQNKVDTVHNKVICGKTTSTIESATIVFN